MKQFVNLDTKFESIELKDNMFKRYGKEGDNRAVSLKKYSKVEYELNVRPENRKLHDSGFNLLTNTMFKLHEKYVKPKFYFTYGFDIPIVPGDGFVEGIEYQVLDFVGISDDDNLFNNQANIIPRVNASMIQKTAKVLTYQVAYDLKYVEMEKMQRANSLVRNVTDVFRNVITVGWDLWLQKLCYTGIESAGISGLFNHPNVMVHTLPAPAKGGGDSFEDYTNEEIIALINGIIAEALVQTNFNVSIIPDTLLIPLKDMEVLSNRTSDISFGKTLYEFLTTNNLAMNLSEVEGFKLKIKARKQLDTMGTNSTGRIVAYRNDEEFVRVDIPQQIKLYMERPNIERAAYTSIFIGQASEVQLPYNESNTEVGIVSYWDFLSA